MPTAEQPDENYGREEPTAETPKEVTFEGLVNEKPEFKDVSRSVFSLEDFVSTFPKHQQDWYAKYQEALKLRHQKGISQRNIARELNIKLRTIKEWLGRRRTSLIESRIQELRFWGLYPLAPDNPHLPFIALLAGWCTGDGHLSRNLHYVNFYEESRESLDNLKTDFHLHFPEISPPNLWKEKYANSYTLKVHNTALAHLFAALGVPTGNKTKVPFSAPQFVLKGSKNVKRYYLAGLLLSEASTPKLCYPHAVKAISFGMVKVESLKHEQIKFLEQIRDLLNVFGITTSNVLSDRVSPNPKFYFIIHGRMENFMRLQGVIPLEFFYGKNQAMKMVARALEYHKKRAELYYRAKALSVEGRNAAEISRKLEIPYTTARNWIKGKCKPRLAELRTR